MEKNFSVRLFFTHPNQIQTQLPTLSRSLSLPKSIEEQEELKEDGKDFEISNQIFWIIRL